MAHYTLPVFRHAVASCRPILRASTKKSPFPRPFSTRSSLLAKKYTETHEWVDLSPDGKTCTIGISEHAAKALGDIVFVELPETDQQVEQGEAFGVVESVKSASDIISPVAGKVVEANTSLSETPGSLNNDPEGSAWLAKIEVEDTSSLDSLMSKESYDQFADH